MTALTIIDWSLKGQKLPLYVFFAPELMIVDCSALACFYQVKVKNSSILAKIPTLGAFSDLILICIPHLHRLQIFLKSLAMHMNSYKTFLSHFYNDATHLTCLF